ncbi:sec20 family protein [Trifolium pratense]|uniref:Sec20 family protein n=1 Tax=Trifolium pratense TaxID=57577 RepID=A0A2K3P5W6_TRIPR|nr:sec20 family protein [Trifolium pratense]
MEEIDKVVEEVEKVKKEWNEAYSKTQDHIKAIGEYGKSGRSKEDEKNSLARLNGIAQDGLSFLSSLDFNLDLLAPQLPTQQEVDSARKLLQSWKTLTQSLRQSLRNANLQAKANLRKAAQEEAIYLNTFNLCIALFILLKYFAECNVFILFYMMQRELLLGGGEESTVRRRNLQTKAGMTSAAESITESLRRTRQLMVQEVERNTSTLMTLDESTGVLKKAESEYKGHRSLLMRTRNLLSTMQRQDIIDRVILGVGFLLFSLAVLYVVSKRIGILTLQRKVTGAIKAGMVGQAVQRPQAVADDMNLHQVRVDHAPLQQQIHDEL